MPVKMTHLLSSPLHLPITSSGNDVVWWEEGKKELCTSWTHSLAACGVNKSKFGWVPQSLVKGQMEYQSKGQKESRGTFHTLFWTLNQRLWSLVTNSTCSCQTLGASQAFLECAELFHDWGSIVIMKSVLSPASKGSGGLSRSLWNCVWEMGMWQVLKVSWGKKMKLFLKKKREEMFCFFHVCKRKMGPSYLNVIFPHFAIIGKVTQDSKDSGPSVQVGF